MDTIREVVESIQLGLFDFDKRIPRPEEVWSVVAGKMPGFFDRTPTIIPNDDVPENDSRWILKLDSTQRFSLMVARSRADFSVTGFGPQAIGDVRAGFVEHSLEFAELFSAQQAKRIGLIVRLFYPTNSPHAMAARMLSGEVADEDFGSVAVTYVVHKKFGEIPVNDNTMVESAVTANIADMGLNLSVVHVVRDLNVANGTSWTPTHESVGQFLKWALDSLGMEKLEGLLCKTME